MTTYQFGSVVTNSLIEKSFENEDMAFEYAMGMTDGPDRVPIWKTEDGKRYAWHQEGWEEGKWVEVEKESLT